MKLLKILGIFFLCTILNHKGYSQIKCASDVDLTLIQQVNPARYQRILALEQFTQNYINSVSNENNTARLITPNATIVIPIVVHVLHRGEAVGVGRNITDAQIQSQIAVLNEDFRRLNADRVNTPAAFLPVADDPNFEFRLACIDPNGNQTNGITRTFANTVQFQPLNNRNADGSINEQATGIKFTAQGGIDAWATNRYLNIWVCDMGGGLIGYGQFPDDYTTKPTTDGVVMLFNAFGRVGNLQFGLNQGRVCVHEIGHWLNLRHIWGDANCGNDFVDDTPTQQTSNTGCPTFPHTTCGNGTNGDMFMNYMDYTANGCQNIYTRGQSLRMRAIFATGGPRAAFIDNYFSINQPTAPICNTGTVTATNPNCIPITWTIVSGPATISGGQGTNTVTLQKSGNGQAVLRATSGGYIDEKTITIGTGVTDFTFTSLYTTPSMISGSLRPYVWATTTNIPHAQFYNWYYKIVSGPGPGGGSFVYASTSYSPYNEFSLPECDKTYVIKVEAITPCGNLVTPLPEGYVYGDCGNNFSMTVYPNPASNELNVVIQDESAEAKKMDKSAIIKYQLYHVNSATLVQEWTTGNISNTTQLNITGIKPGNYILVVSKGKYKQVKKIIIK